MAVACSSPPPYTAEQCEDAAVTQAIAEQRWLDAVQSHAIADAAVATDATAEAEHNHDRAVDETISARVDALVAEAATLHHCGTR